LASGLTLAERTWVPAMVPWRATDSGFVSDDVLDWYGRFAEGQPGALVIEATGIRDVPSGPLLRIGHDRFIDGLRALVDVVRRRSAGRTRLLVQIIDFLRIRRRPAPKRYFEEFLVLEPRHRDALAELADDPRWRDRGQRADGQLRAQLLVLSDDELQQVLSKRELEALRFGARERVWDTHLAHVEALPQTLPGLFADAAARARDAGFDGVELHYAHAYTMASFLSALNVRSDGYGGPREQRVRLPLEVYRAVRKRVGAGYTVGCRMLCDESIAGGSGVADAGYFATELARAGMDYISLSTGGKFEDARQPRVGEAAYPYTGPSGYECMPTVLSDARGPFARNLPKQAQVRRELRAAGCTTPVVVCGGICTFEQAETALRDGTGDIVAAARQSLADPDWFRKLRLGHGGEIRRCKYTNYCEALDQKHRQVTCQLWDRVQRDAPGVPLSADGRRRLVAPRWQAPAATGPAGEATPEESS
jgi:2,4-dienoyl-CoA reductase-like NADH-dependent reductase (Old Yellow Enzyme family)